MTKRDLDIVDSLLKRTEELPDILHLRAYPIGYQHTEEDKKLLLDTYQKLDDILKELAAFINVKFEGRQDYIEPWNDIDFDAKIGSYKVKTTDRELIKSAWKKGMFDLKSLIKSIRNEVILLIDESNEVSMEITKPVKSSKRLIKDVSIGVVITVVGGLILWVITEVIF